MQGIAKIQLFDSISGKVVDEHIDHNFVTNAYKTMQQEFLDYTLFNSRYINTNTPGIPSAIKPIVPNNLSNGLIMCSQALSTDANLLYADTPIVGYAGGTYAGADANRGTLNTAESGAVSNGYKYVWDFATDKCNATINAIALVPRVFGDKGVAVIDQWDWYGDYMGNNSIHPSANVIYSMTSGTNQSTGPTIRKWTKGNVLMDTGFQWTSDILCTLTGYDNLSRRLQLFDGYLYAIGRDTTDGYKYKLIKINTTTGAIVSTFHLSSWPSYLFETMNTWHIFSDGILYHISSLVMGTSITFKTYDLSSSTYGADAVVSISGAYTTALNAQSGFFMQPVYGGVLLYLIVNGSTYVYVVFIKNDKTAIKQIDWTFTGNASAGYTKVSFMGMNGWQLNNGDNQSGTRRTMVQYLACQLFTKNNLASPVTKTNANTMKVTYQLNW